MRRGVTKLVSLKLKVTMQCAAFFLFIPSAGSVVSVLVVHILPWADCCSSSWDLHCHLHLNRCPAVKCRVNWSRAGVTYPCTCSIMGICLPECYLRQVFFFFLQDQGLFWGMGRGGVGAYANGQAFKTINSLTAWWSGNKCPGNVSIL